MSKTLRVYPTCDDEDGKEMSVTAYVAGKHGKGIQFTIGGKYCCLAENQTRNLITVLQKRLKGADGYQATDGGASITVQPRQKREH